MSWTWTTTDMPKWMGKRPPGLNHTQRTIGNKRMLRVGGTVFPREEDSNWLSNGKWSTLKTNIEVTFIQTVHVIFRITYVYT